MREEEEQQKGKGQRWKLRFEGEIISCACFPLEIKHRRTLMQAKPPLACHANLVAEWGGVAAREGSGSGGVRELGLGWGTDEPIMCIEAQQ